MTEDKIHFPPEQIECKNFENITQIFLVFCLLKNVELIKQTYISKYII